MRSLCTTAVLSALVWPAIAAGQVTLVVRAGGALDRQREPAIDAALRESTRGSVRRVDSTMEELALAAGCPETATDAPCVTTIARVAQVHIVALQHLSHEGSGWRVRIALRGDDGSRLREVSVECDDATDCTSILSSALSAAPGDVGVMPREPLPVAPPVEPAPSTLRTEHTATVVRAGPEEVAAPPPGIEPPLGAPAPVGSRPWPLVPTVLFAAGTGLTLGACIAGAFTLAYASDVASLGPLSTRAEVDRAWSVEDQSNVSLGFGIALATAAIGLAVAGALTLILGRGPPASAGSWPSITF